MAPHIPGALKLQSPRMVMLKNVERYHRTVPMLDGSKGTLEVQQTWKITFWDTDITRGLDG